MALVLAADDNPRETGFGVLDLVNGPKRSPAIDALVEELRRQDWAGTLYVGYPVLRVGEQPEVVDALLTSEEHGVVIFDVPEANAVPTPEHLALRRDELITALTRSLLAYRPLARRGRLLVEVEAVSLVMPDEAARLSPLDPSIVGPGSVLNALRPFSRIDASVLEHVNAGVQRIGNIKASTRRRAVEQEYSRGWIMQEIEKATANLDRYQKIAAIEIPDGPQRIRGLAGAGKTVVLAHKAAFLHAQNSSLRICVTFHTRSLYQQLRDLVRRFYYEQTDGDEPNWERLQIMHAWGSSDQPGLYSTLAVASGHAPQTFGYARERYSYERAFDGVCKELVKVLEQDPIEPLFDAVLIDEAQDLPRSFFQLAWFATAPPHRVVWAYDELQNLSAYRMAPPEELFGTYPNGVPRIPGLTNSPDTPRQDIILPKCYRNTPWALTVAHALGFGIYRDKGPVQFFDDPDLWNAIGYETVRGRVAPDEDVTLARRADATPDYFLRLIKPQDAVICKSFPDDESQIRWVAQEIHHNLTRDELSARDILVVFADRFSARTGAGRLTKVLAGLGHGAHLAGVTSSVDELFSDSSVAMSGVFRAKGNEAPMVYVLDAQTGVGPDGLIARRNSLFTAITRSRAWVRICGWGPGMEEMLKEVTEVVQHDYRLDFHVPTEDRLQQLRMIHRDRTRAEREKARRAHEGFSAAMELAELGDNVFASLTDEQRAELRSLLQKADRAAADEGMQQRPRGSAE